MHRILNRQSRNEGRAGSQYYKYNSRSGMTIHLLMFVRAIPEWSIDDYVRLTLHSVSGVGGALLLSTKTGLSGESSRVSRRTLDTVVCSCLTLSADVRWSI
jgi:hypothetical protein